VCRASCSPIGCSFAFVHFTASSFFTEATSYSASVSPRVVLVDGQRLAELMIDYNVAVTNRQSYDVKRVDGDYFGEDE
jgi:restriction system protein